MSDPLQFEVFMRDNQNMVFSTAYRLLADRAEAEDISQEVFLKAHTHFADLHSNPSARGWLRTVTRNLCLSFLTRRRSRWRLFSEMESGDESGSTPYEAGIPAEDSLTPALDARDRQALLGEALAKLPTPQRVALVLYHYHELSYEEIAAHLKISLAKVKVDIHRARKTLHRNLAARQEALLG